MKSGDWIIEKETGRLGILGNFDHTELVSIRFGRSAVALRHIGEIELAPLDLQEDDLETLIEIALATNDKDWFLSLSERVGGYKVDKV